MSGDGPEWDWDVNLIPGGRDLQRLATDIAFRGFREDPENPFALSTRLIELHNLLRAGASKRARELQKIGPPSPWV